MALWTPTSDTANLHGWWDSQDTGNTTLDGSNFSQLSDKSGNGRHATNATTGATQPAEVASSNIGSNRAARADGGTTDCRMQVGSVWTPSANIVMTVSGADSTNLQFSIGATNATTGTGAATNDVAAIWMFQWGAFGWEIRKNGTVVTSSATAQGTSGMWWWVGSINAAGGGSAGRMLEFITTPVGYLFNRNSGSGRGFDGDWGEAGVRSADLNSNSALRQLYEGYLAHYWDLTAGLDGGHPFKSNPPTDYSLTADAGTFTETGTAAGLYLGYPLTAASGSFSLTGQDATLTYTPITGYTLTADAGGITLAGQVASLLYGRSLSLDSGSYSLTGQAASLLYGSVLAAGSGSFAHTGQDVGLSRTVLLAAASASFTLTGQDATLSASARTMAADAGSYSLAGQDVGLTVTRLLTASGGSLIETGQDASLLAGKSLPAAFGQFVLSGQDVSFLFSRIFQAESGSVTLTGQDATLIKASAAAFSLTAESGAFVLAGGDVTLTGPFWTPVAPVSGIWTPVTVNPTTWTPQ